MKKPAISRRALLRLGVYSLPAACAADAFVLEPKWVRVRRVSLTEHPSARIAHITDIHFRGDAGYLGRVVELLNGLEPDLVCFTGDLVEDAGHLPEALRVLAGVEVPVFGVPGNWDHLHRSHFDTIACMDSTRRASARTHAWTVN